MGHLEYLLAWLACSGKNLLPHLFLLFEALVKVISEGVVILKYVKIVKERNYSAVRLQIEIPDALRSGKITL